jgi:hypothetical protein
MPFRKLRCNPLCFLCLHAIQKEQFLNTAGRPTLKENNRQAAKVAKQEELIRLIAETDDLRFSFDPSFIFLLALLAPCRLGLVLGGHFLNKGYPIYLVQS